MQKRGVLEDKKDYPKVLKTISKIGQTLLLLFLRRKMHRSLAHYTGSFTNRTLKRKITKKS
jgi:hypothetical protein